MGDGHGPDVATAHVALLGAGRMGRVHARALASGRVPVDVVAVVDPDVQRSQEVAELIAKAGTVGRPAVRTDPRSVLDGVDGWVVVTPTPTHPDLVRRALGAGLHVFCEKPLSEDPAETRALGALATDVGRILAVGFYRRFSPPFASARQVVAAGEIGTAVLMRASQWDADPPSEEFLATGGDIASDCGVHEFDLVEWLLDDEVVEVRSLPLPVVSPAVGRAELLDNLVIELRLGRGTLALVELSRNCRYADDVRTEVLGTDGAVFVDTLPVAQVRVGTAAGMRTLAVAGGADAFEEGVVGELAAFASVLRGEVVPDLASAEASARASEVAAAAQLSVAQRAPVTVGR